jgi:hypothetical protein
VVSQPATETESQSYSPALPETQSQLSAQTPPVSATVTQLHPVEKPAPRSEPEHSPLPAGEPESDRQARDELNWSDIAFDLKLDGIARQFAINSIVKSWADNRLHLAFKPELEVMLKPELEAQIKQAIGQQLGVSLTLELSTQAVLDVETPYEASLRKLEQERQQVMRAIEQDELVQQLKESFGVELVEASVKKQQSTMNNSKSAK